jgi:hypothetical protein
VVPPVVLRREAAEGHDTLPVAVERPLVSTWPSRRTSCRGQIVDRHVVCYRGGRAERSVELLGRRFAAESKRKRST